MPAPRIDPPTTVTFFFPYHLVSGVPFLFARMAQALGARGYDCIVVDYPNGCLANLTQGAPGVRLMPFEAGESLRVPADSLLVMQGILPATLRPELNIAPETRVAFWVLHAMNFVQTLIPTTWGRHLQTRYPSVQHLANHTVMRMHTKRLGSFLEEVHCQHSLWFMDGSTLDTTRRYLDVALSDPTLLPVLVDVPADNPRRLSEKQPLTAAWLGRLDDFKVSILNHTLRAIERHAAARGQEVVMRVVGEGPLEQQVVTPNPRHVIMERLGTLTGDSLTRALSSSDVLFAMGTSALEGARRGVPTVLLDYSYGAVPAHYRFRWLFTADRDELGRLIDADLVGPEGGTVSPIFDALALDAAGLSQKSFEYCRDHHSIDCGVERFLAAAGRARFTWGGIPAALRNKGLTRRLYEHVRARRLLVPSSN